MMYDYATTTVTYGSGNPPCAEARGLKKALDYHAPFYTETEPWPNIFVQGTPLNSEHGMGIYELAYSRWQEPQYLDVLNEWSRPLGTNNWPFGVVTLTHANQFLLNFEQTPPSITFDNGELPFGWVHLMTHPILTIFVYQKMLTYHLN